MFGVIGIFSKLMLFSMLFLMVSISLWVSSVRELSERLIVLSSWFFLIGCIIILFCVLLVVSVICVRKFFVGKLKWLISRLSGVVSFLVWLVCCNICVSVSYCWVIFGCFFYSNVQVCVCVVRFSVGKSEVKCCYVVLLICCLVDGR